MQKARSNYFSHLVLHIATYKKQKIWISILHQYLSKRTKPLIHRKGKISGSPLATSKGEPKCNSVTNKHFTVSTLLMCFPPLSSL